MWETPSNVVAGPSNQLLAWVLRDLSLFLLILPFIRSSALSNCGCSDPIRAVAQDYESRWASRSADIAPAGCGVHQ
jgi:hypothetical protein